MCGLSESGLPESLLSESGPGVRVWVVRVPPFDWAWRAGSGRCPAIRLRLGGCDSEAAGPCGAGGPREVAARPHSSPRPLRTTRMSRAVDMASISETGQCVPARDSDVSDSGMSSNAGHPRGTAGRSSHIQV